MTSEPEFESAGSAPALTSMDVTVIYSAQDGRVVHLHHELVLQGAERGTPQQHEEGAREAAIRLGHELKDLETLHVPNFDPKGKAYRVDLKTRQLVELKDAWPKKGKRRR